MARCRGPRTARHAPPLPAGRAGISQSSRPSAIALAISFSARIFGRRQAEPGEPRGARPDQGLRREGIIGVREPSPDRVGARGGELLRHHDAGKPGKAAGTPAQRQPASHGRDRHEAGVGREQHCQSVFDIGFGLDAAGHGGSSDRARYLSLGRDVNMTAAGHLAPGLSPAMAAPVFRFAPSPNGYLHLGHAYSAVLNARMAREAGGRLLLRIEDIDATRCRPEFEAAILEDLHWLGLVLEEPVRRQSQHLAAYAEALARLQSMGLIYPSFESRAEIAAQVAAREGRGAVAARSRRRAALSRQRQDAYGGGAGGAHGGRCALCAAARHGGGPRSGRPRR